MTEREALKLALEALEKSHICPLLPDDCAEAITAIKEALMSVPDGAQPESWEKFCDSNCVWTDHHPDCKLAEQPAQQWTDETAKVPDHVWDEKCVIGHCGWPSGCADSERCRADNTPAQQQEPVATDWERIARVQNAKLRAMCDEAGGFEKLCEVMDKYEQTTPPQRKPLTDEEERKAFEQWYVCNAFDYERNPIGSRECGLQWSAWKARAAHGIKELKEYKK